jgi:hypothetical protein
MDASKKGVKVVDRKQAATDYAKYLKYTKGYNLEVFGQNYTEKLPRLVWMPVKNEAGRTEDYVLGEIENTQVRSKNSWCGLTP